jgi:cytochrome c oxidase assembly factor CtaG
MPADPSAAAVLTDWAFDPTIVLAVALAAAVYAAGYRDLAHRGRRGQTVARRHAAYFGLGLLAIVLALVSPVDALSGRLLSMHMVQHLLLLMVAPPLLLLGRPIPVLVVGAPRPLARWLARSHARTPWFRGVTSLLTRPFVAWPIFFAVLLTWHLPALYDAALRDPGVHLLEHLSFLTAGILFWWVVVQPQPGRTRLAHGWRLLYVLAAMLPGSVLGLLFIVTGTPLYPFYAGLARLWGISVLDDQSLAGTIMLVGEDGVLACAMIPLFAGMMDRLEQIEMARFARLQQGE